MSPYHQQQGRLREGLQAEKKKNVDFFFSRELQVYYTVDGA